MRASCSGVILDQSTRLEVAVNVNPKPSNRIGYHRSQSPYTSSPSLKLKRLRLEPGQEQSCCHRVCCRFCPRKNSTFRRSGIAPCTGPENWQGKRCPHRIAPGEAENVAPAVRGKLRAPAAWRGEPQHGDLAERLETADRAQLPIPVVITKMITKPSGLAFCTQNSGLMAERAGFEPARGVNPYAISSRAHSSTLAPLRNKS